MPDEPIRHDADPGPQPPADEPGRDGDGVVELYWSKPPAASGPPARRRAAPGPDDLSDLWRDLGGGG